MRKKMFLWFIPLVVILICFTIQVYAFQDLTRKEAERLNKGVKYPAAPAPVYLYFYTGKLSFPKHPEDRLNERHFLLYSKLHQLNLIHLRGTEEKGGLLGSSPVYEIKITEERKNDLIEVDEKGREFLRKFTFVAREKGWYQTKLFSFKSIGCTGVRNFKERKEAIADFGWEFVEHTDIFFTIAESLKRVVFADDFTQPSNYFLVFLRKDWLNQVINDPQTKVTLQFTFDLYDDGWRIRKMEAQ